MVKREELYALQVAGLLHDFGKFCHKYNNGKAKHNILSAAFVDYNNQLLAGANKEAVINMILKHHDVTDEDFKNAIGANIEPDTSITAAEITRFNDIYNDATYANLVKLLRQADGLSASGDRASESGADKGAHAEYALIWSPITRALGCDDIAVKSSSNYKVIRYEGDDDSKATVLANDSFFDTAMQQKYERIMSGLASVRYIEDLNKLLEAEWSTVNPNTWRPKGAKIGNTTTSLYDHSKTTAAIAGCLYVNTEGSGIDIVNIHLNGTSNKLYGFVIKELNDLGLYSMCIISKVENEVLFMYPHNEITKLENDIKEFNKEIFSNNGETIDYKIADTWQFRGCTDTFNERVGAKHYGVLDVVNDVNKCPNVQEDDNKCYDILVGYRLTNFDYIMNHLMNDNDSISKVATSLRIFEMFANDVEKELNDIGAYIVELSLDAGYFSVKSIGEYYEIAQKIKTCYEKYVLDATGLIISNVKCDRYCDNLAIIKSQLQVYYDKRAEKDAKSYIRIRTSLYGFNGLMAYLHVKKSIVDNNINTSTLVKLSKIMCDLIAYADTQNNECLIALSRLNYLITNERNEKSKKFEKECLTRIYSNEKDELNSGNLKIYYQAIYDTIHKES